MKIEGPQAAEPYTSDFYHDLDSTAEPSARVIVPMVLGAMRAESVVDIGCGDGGWLATFKSNGTDRILGVEGGWIEDAVLKIPRDAVIRADLGQPLPFDDRFSLAMSLEVAEHLPQSRAAGFVGDLTRLAPVVLFSAAVPGQGGVNHVNEQWPVYWAGLFSQHGYRPIDYLRWAVWDNADVAWWYKQNLLLFASDQALEDWPTLAEWAQHAPAGPYGVVHPDCFAIAVRAGEPGLGRWLKMGRPALKRALGKP